MNLSLDLTQYEKNLLPVLVCFIVSVMIGCQKTSNEDVSAISPKKAGAARRACSNTISYGFLKPDTDYGYNGDGCVTYYVNRNTTRQFKVKLANTAGYAQPVQIRVDHPYNPAYFNYTVASYTGGSIQFVQPVPNTNNGESIVWTVNNMPGYTTYEMIINVAGTSASGENSMKLTVVQPCPQEASNDCELDDNIHMVLH